ncbi:hypothetical protein [Aquitalea pelogenes]|uniref:hypothetical protein n=1 Tax=Aquitalea pelogenes TaxID=1293573 RepID=UPI00128F64A7|nr:hypothetical protein [Aquitalea pelogenes]
MLFAAFVLDPAMPGLPTKHLIPQPSHRFPFPPALSLKGSLAFYPEIEKGLLSVSRKMKNAYKRRNDLLI